MKYQQKVIAWLYPSGHVQVDTTAPDGVIILMEGEREYIINIMEGNADALHDQSGITFWQIGAVSECETSTQKYIVAMLWLARIARSYGALKEPVEFFVNKAANRDLRRAAARAINQMLN